MARIKNYVTDNNITDQDIVVGSDGDNSGVTKNFNVGALKDHILQDVNNKDAEWGSITGDITDQTDLIDELNKKVDKVTGKGLSTNDYTTPEKTKLAGIQDGAEVNVNADWNATSGDAQILNKPTIPSAIIVDSIPTNGSTNAVSSDGVFDALANKVDKVTGKGLSTNDYTTAEQTKLVGIAAGAEVNVNADWNSVSGDSQILNKPTIPSVDSVPTNGSTNAVSSDGVFDALALKADLVAGKVPSSQLPSYVDDVIEVADYASLPLTGETGKLYLTINTGFVYRWTGSVYVQIAAGGSVTSVGLTMPSAFAVTNSPITSSGNIAVTGAGTTAQYVRGDGTLANFPNSTGGGSSVNYYLNGSVSQGTFGGDTYYEMSKTPILGAGTNFTRTNGAGNGYIASFITDAGDPSFLNIPGGNWNLEFYFQSSASGGTPQFYGEIYKVSATNVFTLVASGSANPEGITNGTAVDQYFTSIPVPQTTLLITDRLAIRIYVITGGRTLTLHTENGNLCEVLTTFTTGLTALNGLTDQVQYFAIGTTGTDFGISSATDTHTFNLPTASAANRGALSSSDWTAFNNKVSTSRTISTTSPLSGGGDLSADRTLSIHQANGSTNGYLSSTDWNAFNNKQEELVSTTNIKTINGVSILGSGDINTTGTSGNQLLTGGASWSGTGMVYNVTSLTYIIDGTNYGPTTPANVTLSNGDPSFSRFDAIVVDITGIPSVIIGTPASNPITPTISEDYVLIQYVLVGAAATTPSITNEFVYREGSSPDWTQAVVSGASPSLSASFVSTTPSPFQGSQSTLITAPSYTSSKFIQYTKPSGSILRSTFSFVTFRVNLPVALPTRSVLVSLYNGTTLIGSQYATSWGLNLSTANTWQLVSIPTSIFGNASITTVTRVMFRFTGVALNTQSAGYDLFVIDDVKFQSGYGPQANISTITVESNGTSIGNVPKLNFINGLNTSVSSTYDNLNNKVNVGIDVNGIVPLTRQEFNYTGSQNFTLSSTPSDIYAVFVDGQELNTSQYSFSGTTLTIVDTLETNDKVNILYTPTSVGILEYYTKAQINALTIATTAPLTGGGNLSTNRTLSMPPANSGQDGFLYGTDFSYFSDKQEQISITTEGFSGPATFGGTVLNIPNYEGFIPKLKGHEIFRGANFSNNSTTDIVSGGVTMSTTASTIARSVASTNFASKQIRKGFYGTVASAGRYTGFRGSALLFYIGGGFKYVCDFHISDSAFGSGCRQFYGLAGQTTDLGYSDSILVSSLTNIIGIGSDALDTNLQVFYNDATGTATKLDLGVNFPANRSAGAALTTVYGIELYNDSASTDVKYCVKNKETGSTAMGTLNSNLPLHTQGLNFFASRCMGAGVTNTGQFDLLTLGVYSL